MRMSDIQSCQGQCLRKFTTIRANGCSSPQGPLLFVSFNGQPWSISENLNRFFYLAQFECSYRIAKEWVFAFWLQLTGKSEPFLGVKYKSFAHIGDANVVTTPIVLVVFSEALKVEVKRLIVFVVAATFWDLILLWFIVIAFPIYGLQNADPSLGLVAFAEPVFCAFEYIFCDLCHFGFF